MLNDIYQEPCKVKVDEKEYLFEFNHLALASLEKRIGRSVYSLFNELIDGIETKIEESWAIAVCGLMKNHSAKEILAFEQKLKERPGIWFEIKSVVLFAFLLPLLTPSILDKLDLGVKKKEAVREKKKKTVKK